MALNENKNKKCKIGQSIENTIPWQGIKPEWPAWRPKPSMQEDETSSIAAKKKKARDDFKNIPSKWEPKYAYKRDAVCKKSERMKLKGTDCDCCHNFWTKTEAEIGKEEAQKLKDKVSGHRDNFPRPSTPPGFWNPVFSSSDSK